MTLGKRSVVVLALAAAAPCAAASTAPASTGGAAYTPLPVISTVECASLCAGKTRVQAGGTLRVTGKRLRKVRTVTFHGSERTKRDNVSARVRPRSGRRFTVRVPMGAES